MPTMQPAQLDGYPSPPQWWWQWAGRRSVFDLPQQSLKDSVTGIEVEDCVMMTSHSFPLSTTLEFEELKRGKRYS